MLRELRTYERHPGKVPGLIRRFGRHTLAIFDRLGIRHSDFWLSTVDPNQLICFLFWDDMAERVRKWPLFLAGAEWLRARAASEANGPVTAGLSSRHFTTIAFSKPVNHQT